MKTLFFDTETTGLPPKGAEWEINYSVFPFIVQISWKTSDSDKMNDYIIKPVGYSISDEASKIHGITTEQALEKGVLFEDVIKVFISDCESCERVVGHNMYFDTSIIKANTIKLINSGKLTSETIDLLNTSIDKTKRIDTMYKTIQFCSIPFPNGYGKKWPKLEELYSKLFNEDITGAHNSANDVIATEKCYNKLVELGIIV